MKDSGRQVTQDFPLHHLVGEASALDGSSAPFCLIPRLRDIEFHQPLPSYKQHQGGTLIRRSKKPTFRQHEYQRLF